MPFTAKHVHYTFQVICREITNCCYMIIVLIKIQWSRQWWGKWFRCPSWILVMGVCWERGEQMMKNIWWLAVQTLPILYMHCNVACMYRKGGACNAPSGCIFYHSIEPSDIIYSAWIICFKWQALVKMFSNYKKKIFTVYWIFILQKKLKL